MRTGYEHVAGLPDVLRRAGELSAKTVIFDVEPLVAEWASGQEALDRGVALVLGQVRAIPGVRVVCFATNSVRRPSDIPHSAGVRVLYVASAGKPLWTAPYRSLPVPGVVIGDQVATDGILARRLRYTFLHYCPRPDRAPIGPRLLGHCGRFMRPFLFTRPGVTDG